MYYKNNKEKVNEIIKYFSEINRMEKEKKRKEKKKEKKRKKKLYSENYTDESLIYQLKKLSKQLGRTPCSKDINMSPIINTNLYVKHFGSLVKAQEKAGLVPNKKQRYSNEYLLNYLKELSNILGRTPKCDDINKAGRITATTYVNRFGSFVTAKKKAGLVPNKKIKTL